jgi:hypothetical protein
VARADILYPNVLTIDVTGPLSIAESNQASAFTADWTIARAQVRAHTGAPEQYLCC